MDKCQTITILGGGTSAWLTTAFLLKHLPSSYFNIQIIEGKNSHSVGVGESTLPFFPRFMEMCGFNIKEWFNFCECTHKTGVGFKDWINPNTTLWHPFGDMPIFKDNSTIFDLLKHLNIPESQLPTYFRYYSSSILKNQPPQNLEGVHISASKLVEFIKINLPIKSIKEDITDIKYNNGNIISLLLSSGQSFTSDLFIDCLGFKSIIKEKNPTYNFQNKSHSTPVNAAIFNPTSYNSPNAKLVPYTEAQCTPYGWIWKTPLQTRLGAGMVFNKDITSKEEAIEWYEKYWGKENLINPKTKYIEFTPGYYTNQWNKNVISIGLSTGFIEPLEATGIQLILEGILNSIKGFSKGWYGEEDINLFNNEMNAKYSSTFDFITIHYLKTNHKTPFWNYVKNIFPSNIPESLKFRINHFQNFVYDSRFIETTKLFSDHSWYYTIAQFTDIFPKTKKVLLENPQLELENYLKETN